MRFLWISAKKDLRRLARDPAGVIAWIGNSAGDHTAREPRFFAMAPRKPHGVLLVIDEDKTFVSLMAPSVFSQGPLAEMITVEKVAGDAESARRRIEAGQASALLMIPKGFGAAFLGRQTGAARADRQFRRNAFCRE